MHMGGGWLTSLSPELIITSSMRRVKVNAANRRSGTLLDDVVTALTARPGILPSTRTDCIVLVGVDGQFVYIVGHDLFVLVS